MKKPKKITRRMVTTMAMVNGNEKKYPTIILNNELKDWVGFGWLSLGPASAADRLKYPTVEDG
jgi:hypothetical protein